jgi:hypothetical protein
MSNRIALAAAALLLSTGLAWAIDFPMRPIDQLTPGVIATIDRDTVCRPGYAREARHTSKELKAEVYLRYDIDKHAGHFEVDHRVPIELGGADIVSNLWPQSYDARWNAYEKDRLENHLHRLVCAGDITLAQAQQEFLGDWIVAYVKYLGQPQGL